ncbi:MAG: M48 family metalloprotease [Actinomycetota bacterium]
MTAARAVLLVAAVSLAAAGVVGLVARVPSGTRTEVVRGPTDPDLGARFTGAEIARHGAFREVGSASFALFLVIEITTLVVLARGAMGGIVAAADRVPGGWITTAVAIGGAAAVIVAVAAAPLAVVGYGVHRQWGLSTQGIAGWTGDYLRATGVSVVVAAVSALAFFGIVRWQPRAWWVIGWAAFSLLSLLFVFLWPLAVAPLFNRFESLPPGPVRQEAFALAERAGVTIDDVLVADASRRSTVENAYVAGIGSSKRLVVYDTLLEAGDTDETAFVIAHELGHRSENHVLKGTLAGILGIAVGFAILAWLAGRGAPWGWAGATGIADFRALPVVLLFALIVRTAALPVENYLSRRFEARADEIALELTGDSATAVRTFRRLAYTNIADLRPPSMAVGLLFSHPPVRDRIEAVGRR